MLLLRRYSRTCHVKLFPLNTQCKQCVHVNMFCSKKAFCVSYLLVYFCLSNFWVRKTFSPTKKNISLWKCLSYLFILTAIVVFMDIKFLYCYCTYSFIVVKCESFEAFSLRFFSLLRSLIKLMDVLRFDEINFCWSVKVPLFYISLRNAVCKNFFM